MADPRFLDLLNAAQLQVEGGQLSDVECDLGLFVAPGTERLDFYLSRGIDEKPRHVRVDMRERFPDPVPIRLRIRQEAAQGTARLTLVAPPRFKFRPIEIHWDRMEELDRTENEILDLLREEPTEVPPVVPQPSNSLLWTEPLQSVGGSLVDFVSELSNAVELGPPSAHDVKGILNTISVLLTRRGAPFVLTRKRVADRKLYRAISSDGELPESTDSVTRGTLAIFDECLNSLGGALVDPASIFSAVRSASVRLGGWCFLRCPKELRQHLLDVALSGHVPKRQIYFRAMGKVFDTAREFSAFFELLERDLMSNGATFKVYQIDGLFYLLSLREDAPRSLSGEQATLFANKLLDRLDESVRARNRLSLLAGTSLKAYASLMRYRLVHPDFMTLKDLPLGGRQNSILHSVRERSSREGPPKIARLAGNLIEWSEKRGADRTILEWEDGENEADTET